MCVKTVAVYLLACFVWCGWNKFVYFEMFCSNPDIFFSLEDSHKYDSDMDRCEITGKGVTNFFQRMIQDKRLETLQNVRVSEFLQGKNQLSFDLTIFEETERVTLDFTTEEVHALQQIVKRRQLCVEKFWAGTGHYFISFMLEDEIPQWKEHINSFVDRNKSKSHRAFCLKHLKAMLKNKRYGCDNYIQHTLKHEEQGRKIPLWLDCTFPLVQLFLLCATPAFDDTEDSPHLLILLNSFEGIESQDMAPMLKAFGASYLSEVEPTKHLCGLDVILREFRHKPLDTKLIKELSDDDEIFSEDTKTEVMISLLNNALQRVFEALHQLCIFCHRGWCAEFKTVTHYLCSILHKIPRKCLNDVLSSCKMNYCQTFRIRRVPNNIYMLLANLLGVKLSASRECCSNYRVHDNSHVQSLRNITLQNAHTCFIKQVKLKGYQVEKILAFQYLPKDVKMEMLQPVSHYKKHLTWENDQHHICDKQYTEDVALSYHHEMESKIFNIFLSTLNHNMWAYRLCGENRNKVEKFLYAVTDNYISV